MRAKPHHRSPGRLRRAAKVKHRVARKRNNSHLMPPRRSSKGEILGQVEAPDAEAAKAPAAVQFDLDEIQRNRIMVQELA